MASIACLIYKSISYLEFVKKSVEEHTDMTKHEFYFVACNPTDEVVEYLVKNKIRHVIFKTRKSDERYFDVYQAWNLAVEVAKHDIVVLVNSDMAFTDGWIDNLLKYMNLKVAITSRLVESGKLPSGGYAISRDFGRTPSEFKKEEFETFAKEVSEARLVVGGMFSPIALNKDEFMKAGGYPFGNVHFSRSSGEDILVPGDVYFWAGMRTRGVTLYTAFDSIVYHIQLGEQNE